MTETAKFVLTESVGFIGAGNMAQAIGFRLLDSGIVSPKNMTVSAPSERNLVKWKERNVNTTNNNADVVKNSEIVFIAVKPQYFKSALSSILSGTKAVRCYVSLMAGINLKKLCDEGLDKSGVEVYRVMPNTPCMVGIGCSVLCSASAQPVYLPVVKNIMSSLGLCYEIEERLFNAVSGLSGSGPAYMYIVLEALADGAVKKGVPRDMALQIAAQVMKGSAEMVAVTKKHPGLLKDEVCSPGGTTICGVTELENRSIRSAFINAIGAASDRADEMTKMQ